MGRKPLTQAAIDADIARRGWASRSLSPAEYEELEQRYEVREAVDKRPHGKHGRRACIITHRKV